MKVPVKILVALFVASIFISPAQAKEAAASADDFVIRSGDVLQITVWKEDGLDREVVVLPDGTITFPLVGTIQAQGFSPGRLQSNIKDMLSTMIPDASVTVMVKAPLGHTVSVMGQVAKPGDIVIGRRMSVMQALSQAGGLTPYADEGDIIVIRNENGEKKSIEYPYKDIARGRDLDKDINLKPGDVVFVPTAGLL